MAQRVGYLCSIPKCNRLTIGAHSEIHKALLIGVAAHITAVHFSPKKLRACLDFRQLATSDKFYLILRCIFSR
jgi:hypothetical protein